MLNPEDLLNAWVRVLKDALDLQAALGGPGNANIEAYNDALDAQNNLRLKILLMLPGTLLVVYTGTTPRKVGTAYQFSHNFSFYLKSYPGAASYASIFSLIVNASPIASGLPLLHYEIDPGCYPMDLDLPTSSRNSILIGPDGSTMDYFEVRVSLTEVGA